MLRARLAKLLEETLVDRLVDAPNLDDALILLRDTPYAAIESLYNRTGDLKTAELELFAEEISLYRDLEKYVDAEVEAMIRALALNYEIETLKNALRLFFDQTIRKRNIEESLALLYPHRIEHDLDPVQIAKADNLDTVVELLERSPYGEIVGRHRESILGEKSLFGVEVSLDQYYFENLTANAENLNKKDRDVALRLIGIEIDLLNINWIVRFRNLYKLPLERVLQYTIPHGFSVDQTMIREAYASEKVLGILQGIVKRKYPSLAALLSAPAGDTNSRILLIERILDQILIFEVRKILSGPPFTIGIILAYFVLKRNEIRRIQAVLNAKFYKLTRERIREKL
jgi:V/A-type H+-transporting ATPase subunit C